MPVRYILPASQVVNINPPIRDSIETAICQNGGDEANRPIITIGDVSGIMLAQTITGASGLSILADIIKNANMMGITIGNINDCASCGSSFTTLPTAANKAE